MTGKVEIFPSGGGGNAEVGEMEELFAANRTGSTLEETKEFDADFERKRLREKRHGIDNDYYYCYCLLALKLKQLLLNRRFVAVVDCIDNDVRLVVGRFLIDSKHYCYDYSVGFVSKMKVGLRWRKEEKPNVGDDGEDWQQELPEDSRLCSTGENEIFREDLSEEEDLLQKKKKNQNQQRQQEQQHYFVLEVFSLQVHLSCYYYYYCCLR